MHNLAKRNTTFLQDIPFISIGFIINTSKCTILQKRKRLFGKIFHLLVCFNLLILANAQSCKKRLFCKIFHLLLCFNINTSKCKILQKRKRLFCEIFHLLVYVSLLILVNANYLQKRKRLLCELFHLLVYVSCEFPYHAITI